ncbi:hypothetical protein ACQE3D_25510 (plasmid) [Methylomonas sp. MS20]|uniref:hypothetical protein n=1 Tax=Methylomonas sp. MS20 TaxID=3418769 RepID=UPI003D06B2B7
MKTFNKTNFHGTVSLSISDSDNAEIFETPNHAIHWLKATGLVDIFEHPIFDDGLFVNAFKSAEYENKYTDRKEFTVYYIFNFGGKAAIYVRDFESYKNENGDYLAANCKSKRFLTIQESDKYQPC